TPAASFTVTGTSITFDDTATLANQTITLAGSTSGFTLTSTDAITSFNTGGFTGAGSFTLSGDMKTVTFSGATNQFTAFSLTTAAGNAIVQIGNTSVTQNLNWITFPLSVNNTAGNDELRLWDMGDNSANGNTNVVIGPNSVTGLTDNGTNATAVNFSGTY